MIIGVESGAEKYPTKRVVQCKPIWKQTVWKYLKNVTYRLCFFFFYRFNNAICSTFSCFLKLEWLLLLVTTFLLLFLKNKKLKISRISCLFVNKVGKQRAAAVPDIFCKSVSVNYSVLAFFWRWSPSWSFETALVGQISVFEDKNNQLRYGFVFFKKMSGGYEKQSLYLDFIILRKFLLILGLMLYLSTT